jgi:hypothetical protein
MLDTPSNKMRCDRKEHTAYMFDTDATFHFETSALNVGLAVLEG